MFGMAMFFVKSSRYFIHLKEYLFGYHELVLIVVILVETFV